MCVSALLFSFDGPACRSRCYFIFYTALRWVHQNWRLCDQGKKRKKEEKVARPFLSPPHPGLLGTIGAIKSRIQAGRELGGGRAQQRQIADLIAAARVVLLCCVHIQKGTEKGGKKKKRRRKRERAPPSPCRLLYDDDREETLRTHAKANQTNKHHETMQSGQRQFCAVRAGPEFFFFSFVSGRGNGRGEGALVLCAVSDLSLCRSFVSTPPCAAANVMIDEHKKKNPRRRHIQVGSWAHISISRRWTMSQSSSSSTRRDGQY